MNFTDKIGAISRKNKSLVCIGLDSELAKIPPHFRNRKFPQYEFNQAVIDATADLVCAYKPNSAFYEARGAEGIGELKATCDYLKKNYPDIPIILDAKRGDIGSTNAGYVQYIFEYLGADAVTVHPYLGSEAVRPFLDCKDKGVIVLCRTSNPGAGEFQDFADGTEPLYRRVAKNVSENWNTNGNCLLVVGATYPEELKAVREIVGAMLILVPGIGAQGGDLAAVLKNGLTTDGGGLIINSARSIIFAASDHNFAQTARNEALKLRDSINRLKSPK